MEPRDKSVAVQTILDTLIAPIVSGSELFIDKITI